MDIIPSFQEILNKTNWSEFIPTVIGVSAGAILAFITSIFLFMLQRRSQALDKNQELKNNIRINTILYYSLRYKFEEIEFRIAEYDGYILWMTNLNSDDTYTNKISQWQNLKHESIVQKDSLMVRIYEVQSVLDSLIFSLDRYRFLVSEKSDKRKAFEKIIQYEKSDFLELKKLTSNPIYHTKIDIHREEYMKEIGKSLSIYRDVLKS